MPPNSSLIHGSIHSAGCSLRITFTPPIPPPQPSQKKVTTTMTVQKLDSLLLMLKWKGLFRVYPQLYRCRPSREMPDQRPSGNGSPRRQSDWGQSVCIINSTSGLFKATAPVKTDLIEPHWPTLDVTVWHIQSHWTPFKGDTEISDWSRHIKTDRKQTTSFFQSSIRSFYFKLISSTQCWTKHVFLNRGSPRAHLHVVVMSRFVPFGINQPTLSTPFYSVLVSVSVFTALSTVFHSINSPDNSPLSHSVLPVLFRPYWSFQLLWKPP